MKEQRKAEYKAPGEKLIKIELVAGSGVIESIVIAGDFFIYPEEEIESLEGSLLGLPVEKASIRTALDNVIAAKRIEMVGISPASITEAIIKAV